MQLKMCVFILIFHLFIVSRNFHAGTLPGNVLMTSTVITDFLQIFNPPWAKQPGSEKKKLLSVVPALAAAPLPFFLGRSSVFIFLLPY